MNTLSLRIHAKQQPIKINLPASKSLSNRALIMQKLGGGKITISNLSDARDSQRLYELLQSDALELNVNDAGTSMRFLCAYCCIANRKSIITGSERMLERPIKPLVDALKAIGFNINYTNKEGFPPIVIEPIENFNQLNSEVEVQGNISSQFVSALLMIAPFLPKGLQVKLLPPVASQPYIDMSIAMLKAAGVKVVQKENSIKIASQPIQKTHFEIEADWTNALYWFSICAILPASTFVLQNLSLNSIQGDSAIADWMKLFGVVATQQKEGVVISTQQFVIPENVGLHFNFVNHPDVAQTIIVLCAAKNIHATFTGLQSLRIKETDRITALQNELAKCSVQLVDAGNETFKLHGVFRFPSEVINTYNDHRMAMAFAPLAALGKLEIEAPWVVEKSYPTFWKELEKML
jgi:3-phosphoshikimate 1-carboxyvinyltransferase